MIPLHQLIITAWQRISPEVIVKGFKKCCISSAVDWTDDDTLCNDSIKRNGMLAVNVRKIKALTVKLNITDNASGQSNTGKGR